MDDADGQAVAALQLAQEGEQRRHLAAEVLVDAMQADEGIEDEETRLQPSDCLIEAGTVGLEIETQCRRGDHLDVEIGDRQTGGSADAVEPPTDDVQSIFGGVEQDASGLGHGEAAQTGRAGGDGDGQIEGEEGFAAFWLAADDANCLLGPQPGDQPALVQGAIGEAMSGLDGQRRHRRRPAAARVSAAGDAAQVSKNSFSSICRASRSAAAASSSPAMFIRARRLPWAWSHRVAISSGVIRVGAPAWCRA